MSAVSHVLLGHLYIDHVHVESYLASSSPAAAAAARMTGAAGNRRFQSTPTLTTLSVILRS